MENEETTVETQDATQEGHTVDETENATEESQSETTEESSEQVTVEQQLAHAQAEAAKYRRLFEKGSKPMTKKAPTQSQAVDVDERILRSQGMSDKVLSELRKVAQVEGVGLIEAQFKPLWELKKQQIEKETKTQQAQLGTSRGSPKVAPKKDFTTPGLSRDEHKDMVKAQLGL